MTTSTAPLPSSLQQGRQPLEELDALLARQRAAFRANPMPSAAERRQWLQALRELLRKEQEAIIRAISADFGNRSADETRLAELMPSLQGIHYASRRLGKWMKPSRRSVGL